MKKLFEYVLLTIGSIIVAGSLELILAPNGLVDGGVTAIAIMANKVAGLPLYGVFLGLNIPILLFTAKVMGKKFFYPYILCKCCYNTRIDLFKTISSNYDFGIINCTLWRSPIWCWDCCKNGRSN